MIYQRSNEAGWLNGVKIKKALWINEWEIEEGEYYKNLSSDGVLVGLNNAVLRLRYPDYSHSKVQYIPQASHDLKCIAALFICGLVRPEILPYKLEEEWECHKEAAQLLRKWVEVKINNDSVRKLILKGG